jgi:hypothetical protein
MLTASAGTCLPGCSLTAVVYCCLLKICCLATDVVMLFVSRPLPRNESCFRAFARNGCFSGSIFLGLSKYIIAQYCPEAIRSPHSSYVRQQDTQRSLPRFLNARAMALPMGSSSFSHIFFLQIRMFDEFRFI